MTKKRTRMSAEERNRRRRERYGSDPEYRKKAIESTRSGYRSRNVLVDGTTCLENLPKLRYLGTDRTVLVGLEKVRLTTFSIKEIADAINRRPEIIGRWIKKGMFPAPEMEVVNASGEGVVKNVRVYPFEQAKYLVTIMGGHQKDTPYYRLDHDTTRDLLFGRIVGV